MQRTRRREFLIGAAVLAAAPLARAQARLPRLALLYPNPFTTSAGDSRVFMAKWLEQLGWVAGRDLAVEHYSGEGREDRLPALADEIVRKGADVIWVAGPEAALAATRATQTIPIAFYGVAFPVEHELVETLARPGRNVTGLTALAGMEVAKSLEILRELAPAARRIGWIRVRTVMRTVSGGTFTLGEDLVDPYAARLGFEIERHRVSAPEDLESAFDAIRRSKPDALACDFTAMTYRERHRIVDFANFHRWPSVFGASPFIEAGGLLSYAANRGWMARHSFTFVDRILRGERPADIPVERPSRFELLLNAKTAKMLGISLPQSLLLRADRVFE
jgi:putative tryptophan/tyrosine transport system substrate-binding protein